MNEISKRLIDGDKLLEWVATRVSALEESVKHHTGYHLRHLTGQHSALIDLEWEIQEGRFDIPSDKGEAARLREALEKCLIGGNSLASVIIGWSLPAGYEQWTHEKASNYFYKKYDEETAYEYYETWLCWKSIREAGEMVDSLSSHTEDKLSFSGEWDFKPGINTEG